MANPIKVIKLTGVSGSLEGKADAIHTHVLADITDAGTAAASDVADFATTAQGTKADNAIPAGTLSSVNSQISDATLIDTADPRLSDSRTPTTHSHTLSQITDSGSAAGLDVATVGNAAAAEVVKGNDTRLSDDRDPTAHTHTLSEISDSGTAAALNAPALGDAAAAEVVKGNDTRLTDDRDPTAHVHTLADITDSGTAAASDVGDFAAASHDHTESEISNLGTNITLNDDTDVSSNTWVLNEPDLASNSATKIPTQASVKGYVDTEVAGVSLSTPFKGAYNASTNTPDLTSPAAVVIAEGDTYIVDTAGSFFGTDLLVGDHLISDVADPTVIGDWTLVQDQLDGVAVKVAYESNADTNAFTNAEKTLLGTVDTPMLLTIRQVLRSKPYTKLRPAHLQTLCLLSLME